MTGKQIKREREKRGLTINELALKADVAWDTVADLEEGGRRPRKKTIKKILWALRAEPVMDTRV